MTKITKALIGTAAATAMAVSATSAVAQNRGYHDNDKISAGEVIAGAVILGGIAAILTSGKNKRNDRGYDDRGYDSGGYDDRGGYHNGSDGYDGNRRDGSRAAVERCVRKAENWASRYGNAKVTEIRDIQRTYDGYQVRGKIVVRDGQRGRGYGYDNYNRGGYDDYGRNGYGNTNYNDGKFTCYVERGRVVDVQYKGLGR